MKKQKLRGKLLIYCPINTISFKNKHFKSRKHGDFEIRSIENAIMNSEPCVPFKNDSGGTKQCVTLREK